MVAKIIVDTYALRRDAAPKTEQAADRAETVLAVLAEELAAAGHPWGDDEFGRQFAEGPQGYRAASAHLSAGAEAVQKALRQFALGIAEGARVLHLQDGASAYRVPRVS